ncbi:hypothetical protein G6F56_010383 [Rhizopus delemar]|nr:hypothetical protein G6F56_010383 [Rhizopus delemar]
MLETKLKVIGFPSYYHRYKDDLPKSTNLQEQIIINNQRQLIQYLNQVYRSGQPVDSDIATHQARLHELISKECKIIGYVRKSPGKESITTRLRLLESMVDKLMKASSVDMVFGSYSSASDELFVKRDTTTTIIIPRTKGNTQAAASYPVTIVVINFAGLTTNKPDLVQFLRDHKTVKNIVIDNIESHNEAYYLTREQILSYETVLQLFDCRSAPVRRSLMS